MYLEADDDLATCATFDDSCVDWREELRSIVTSESLSRKRADEDDVIVEVDAEVNEEPCKT